MNITFEHADKVWQADLRQPLDLSIALHGGVEQVNCFWAPPVVYEPVRAGSFVGSIAEGGPVNFFNIRLNPHGNGTHTECVGHIAKTRYELSDCLKKSHFFAKLVSLYPTKMPDGDRVLTIDTLRTCLKPGENEALLIRTLPNGAWKQRHNYSGTNPPYLSGEAAAYIADCGVEHLLVDLPSVDREEDGGLLSAHRAFWRYPEAVRSHCTISELFYAPDEVKDGYYLLNIQTIAVELDASPSRVVLWRLTADDRRAAV
jgi:arylformamidase